MKRYAIGMIPVLSISAGFFLLHHEWNSQIPSLDASEAQVIVGGGPTCNFGASLDGNTDCLGVCANNATYSSIGANGTAVSLMSCGTCGGSYKGSANCPEPMTTE